MASGGKLDLTVSIEVDARSHTALESLGWASPSTHRKLRDEIERLQLYLLGDPPAALAALSPDVREVVEDTVESWQRRKDETP